MGTTAITTTDVDTIPMSRLDSPQPTLGPPTLEVKNPDPAPPQQTDGRGRRDLSFWLVFASLMISTFLAALDLTAVSVSLPTIVGDLRGEEFVWVGSAYTLGSTAFLPLSGELAQIFGRQPVMLASIVFFAIGSGVSGGSKTMAMMIAGRAIQGIGGGGILNLTEIIVADLVPLNERGTFMGLINAVWAVASAVGPPVGGAFSEFNWRWLFYINLPLTAIAFASVFKFLKLRTPQDNIRAKLNKIDWVGNFLVIAFSSIVSLGLTWGGVEHPWNSYQVLIPLILGFVGLAGFLVYEKYIPRIAVVPWELFNNRTSLSGYFTTALHGIVSTAVVYFLPIYFQSTKGQSPVNSGISIFGSALSIAFSSVIGGVAVTILGLYRPQNFLAWAMTTSGVGLLALLNSRSTVGQYIGYQILGGFGIGILYPAAVFPILASQPVEKTAPALALYAFIRTFSETWGITIGGTVLQNQLKKRLPADFLAMTPEGVEIAFATIPKIAGLPEPLKGQIQDAFSDSIKVIWLVMVGISGLGLLAVPFMKELKMHEATDEQWGVEEKSEPVPPDTST